MNGGYIIAGLVILALSGLMGADYLATTVNTDGSVMVASSGTDENGSFASRAMALDSVRMSRSISRGEETGSDLSITGTGPMLFADYAAAIGKNQDLREFCAFLGIPNEQKSGESSLYTSGILQNETYDASRTIGSNLNGMTMMNGTGMVLLGSQSQKNRTLVNREFITGNMTVNDVVRFGEPS